MKISRPRPGSRSSFPRARRTRSSRSCTTPPSRRWIRPRCRSSSPRPAPSSCRPSIARPHICKASSGPRSRKTARRSRPPACRSIEIASPPACEKASRCQRQRRGQRCRQTFAGESMTLVSLIRHAPPWPVAMAAAATAAARAQDWPTRPCSRSARFPPAPPTTSWRASCSIRSRSSSARPSSSRPGRAAAASSASPPWSAPIPTATPCC